MKKNESIDVLKGITIILVVIAHSSDNFIGNSVLKNFRMPLFFLVSGYLFSFKKYENNFIVLFLDKFKSLIIPYFSFAIIGGALWSLKHIFIVDDFSFIKVIYGIFNANGSLIKGNTPIWFLNCLFISTLLLYIGISKTSGIIQSLIYFTVLSIVGKLAGQIVWLPWSMDISFVAVFLMFLGFQIKENNLLEKIPVNFLSLAIAIICFALSSKFNIVTSMNDRNYGNLVLFYFSGISGSYIVYWIVIKIFVHVPLLSNFLKESGRYSIVILGFHLIFISILKTLTNSYIHNYNMSFILYAFISIFICKKMGFIFRSNNFLSYIFMGKTK